MTAQEDVRPATIINFERLVFGTLALGVVQIWLGWGDLVARAAKIDRHPELRIALNQIVVFIVIASLTLFISRRRSKIALWISIVLYVLGLPVAVALWRSGALVGLGGISLVQTIAQLVAFGLLFTPTARRWFKDKPTSAGNAARR